MAEEKTTTFEIIKCGTCRLRRFEYEYKTNRLGERFKACNVCKERGKKNRAKAKVKSLLKEDPEIMEAKLRLEEVKINLEILEKIEKAKQIAESKAISISKQKQRDETD